MATAPPPPDWSGQQQVANVASSTRAAGFWIRVVAYLIDGFVLAIGIGLMAGIIIGAVALLGGSSNDLAAGIGVLVGIAGLIALGWLYEALMTSSPRGATLGKQAIGVRIVRADGARLSFGRATARHFLKVLVTPLLPFGIGFMLAGWTKGKRALHDLMADTLVVKADR
ncbi:MAG TPA: RDD family protein [Reyranella sp.]|jgi:uncharacterized RDD family membrane protein YckC|nr:RDD family protein [Reyranella sp.]